ncbi:endonuclease Q family protein [Falsibacillus albus]|uniref:TIGR00375 family protein n=1 Tax=Falsibacillus albus TaxID=2478915 RepID=A0A3L7JJJ3_9BACI|nr:endonuclease Q family protein [Falsibacillus albus]RLQ90640.1 TIGR00375 family protein [Falsibacillus albus]
MNTYYVDLHIHIGRDFYGRPVKITGAESLTLENVLKFAERPKGIDMVGVIDCHSPNVIQEINLLIESGELRQLQEGGLLYNNSVTLIPGAEIEIYDQNCKGPIHVLAYFPTLQLMRGFSDWLADFVTNIHLSSQRAYVSAISLQKKVKELEGLFIPAHVFTPFKSLYGKGVEKSLKEVLDPEMIDGVELGLSADTSMADKISELHPYTYLTNSDAHSLGKIGREYQAIRMAEPTFKELEWALGGKAKRKVEVNYGLNPLLGKYHETACAKCSEPWPVQGGCQKCGSSSSVKGVSNRIAELADSERKPGRPRYIHQVPLDFLPGLGPKTLQKLLMVYKTEMAILHDSKREDLLEIIPERIVNLIMAARSGTLKIAAGGAGRYGKVKR